MSPEDLFDLEFQAFLKRSDVKTYVMPPERKGKFTVNGFACPGCTYPACPKFAVIAEFGHVGLRFYSLDAVREAARIMRKDPDPIAIEIAARLNEAADVYPAYCRGMS